MFIAWERETQDVDASMQVPNDRSTALTRTEVAVTAVTLGQHARRFLMVSVTLLATACSSLQLGYNNADTLLAYSLDSYLDLDDEQERLARERIDALHRWHRSTQLAGYAQLLDSARAKVAGPVNAADVLEFNAKLRRQMAAIGDQAAPDLARLALTLRPTQIERLSEKLAGDSSKARLELVRFAGTESLEHRIERYSDRAEEWFGTLTAEQRALIRASLAQRPDAHEAWLLEREQRGRDLVALVTRIRAEQPPPSQATAWVRDYFAELSAPRDPLRRARLQRLRQHNAELVAGLISSATLAQRTLLAQRLRGYSHDFQALTSKSVPPG